MKDSIKKPVLAAVFCAMTLAVTLLRIPLPASGGYIHIGDAVIYLCASFLPLPFAMASAALGGLLSDILAGAAIWVPATVLLKAAIPLFFTSREKKILCRQNVLALVFAGLVTVIGYYLAEVVLFGNWTVPLLSVPGNLAQAVCSALAFLGVGASLDRLKAKEYLK